MRQKISDIVRLGLINAVTIAWNALNAAQNTQLFRSFRAFSVRVSNVYVPEHIVSLQPDVTWYRHKKGGGWVSSTAHADITVYVGPHACVYDNAAVYAYARIEGRARVFDSARVTGNSRVCDDACVMGTAIVRGSACVCYNARLFDAHVAGDKLIMIGQIKPKDDAL